jgi:hypothetical protein
MAPNTGQRMPFNASDETVTSAYKEDKISAPHFEISKSLTLLGVLPIWNKRWGRSKLT